MIKSQKPLCYAEVLGLAGEGEKAKKTKAFIKEFYRLKEEKALALKKELSDLDLIKLKE